MVFAKIETMRLKLPTSVFIFYIFLFLIFSHSLAAYAIKGLPIQWMAQAGFVSLFGWLLFRNKVYLFPGAFIFLLFFLWALMVTFVNYVVHDHSRLMPGGATTPYGVFISLRFLGMAFFVSAAGISYWLLIHGYRDRLLTAVTNIAVIVSLIAIYVYFAQIFGLPELPRTRIGTGGSEASTTFTYAFHRALGTFREPSHLAQWLVTPLFFSYMGSPRWINWKSVIIATAILMTGSLTGILGALVGLTMAVMITSSFHFKSFLVVGRVAVPFLGAFVGFSIFAVSYTNVDFNLISVIWDRIEPILFDQGVFSTNRSYVYEYAFSRTFPLFGDGIGNANLLLGKFTGVQVNVSFLNLFVNYLFASGLIGLVLIGFFFLNPIYLHLFRSHYMEHDRIFLVGAYMAWILMFIMHQEEFSLFFGVLYGVLTYQLRASDERRRVSVSSATNSPQLGAVG